MLTKNISGESKFKTYGLISSAKSVTESGEIEVFISVLHTLKRDNRVKDDQKFVLAIDQKIALLKVDLEHNDFHKEMADGLSEISSKYGSPEQVLKSINNGVVDCLHMVRPPLKEEMITFLKKWSLELIKNGHLGTSIKLAKYLIDYKKTGVDITPVKPKKPLTVNQ